MLDFRWKYYTIIFGTLLTLVACQKIGTEENKDKNTTSGDTTETTTPEENLFLQAEQHIVIVPANEENPNHVLYISLQEWSGLTSSFSTSGNAKALRIASQYREGDITGWRIPTNNDVIAMKILYDVIGDYDYSIEELNKKLEAAGGIPFYNKDHNGTNKRYLCANGDSTYNFLNTHNFPLVAGATVKYYLRLVKDSVTTTKPEYKPEDKPNNKPEDNQEDKAEDKDKLILNDIIHEGVQL